MLALVWSIFSPLLLLFSVMPVLQLGFTLSQQALEDRHPSKPRPPPLPDPFSLSWPLQLCYSVLALSMDIHHPGGWSLQLFACVALGIHLLTVCWKSLGSSPFTATPIQDSKLARRLTRLAWRDLCWRLDCFLFPSVGIAFGLICNLHSFSPIVQCSWRLFRGSSFAFFMLPFGLLVPS